ncbi:hypothetical protein AB0N31_00885 [Streptomyces sp. NPDC051051]|uniref:hypothetical protein n=1 Tax=Streptomyces sp. NPDC051051 TaxID=3155666 RepID=UPI0034172F1A
MRESRSFTGRRVPAAVTDVTPAVLAVAACLAPPKAVPPGAHPLRSPDHWWLVLVLLSSPPLVVDRVEAADRIGLA